MIDITGVIERSPWFAEIPESGLSQLASAAQIRDWPVGACLYSVGEPTTAIYCLLEGRVRVSIGSALGHEFTIVDLNSGAWPTTRMKQTQIFIAEKFRPCAISSNLNCLK